MKLRLSLNTFSMCFHVELKLYIYKTYIKSSDFHIQINADFDYSTEWICYVPFGI